MRFTRIRRGSRHHLARVVRVGRGERQAQRPVREHVGAVGEARPCAARAARRAGSSTPVADARERVEERRRRRSARARATARRAGAASGPRDERPRDRELLLLPARERAGLPAPEVPHDREELVHPLHVGLDAAVRRGARRARAAGSRRRSGRRRCGVPPGRARCRCGRSPRCRSRGATRPARRIVAAVRRGPRP